MSVNEQLLKYGLEAELKVIEYMQSFGLNAFQNEVIPDDAKSIYENMRTGDVYLQHNTGVHNISMNFDVKRGHFISEKSLTHYKGMFFILIPEGNLDDIANAKVVKASTIRHYWSQVSEDRKHTSAHGTVGYRFTAIKNYRTLEDFVTNYIKTIIIMDNSYNSDEYSYRPFTDFLKTFNKVLPKSAKENLF